MHKIDRTTPYITHNTYYLHNVTYNRVLKVQHKYIRSPVFKKVNESLSFQTKRIPSSNEIEYKKKNKRKINGKRRKHGKLKNAIRDIIV